MCILEFLNFTSLECQPTVPHLPVKKLHTNVMNKVYCLLYFKCLYKALGSSSSENLNPLFVGAVGIQGPRKIKRDCIIAWPFLLGQSQNPSGFGCINIISTSFTSIFRKISGKSAQDKNTKKVYCLLTQRVSIVIYTFFCI